MTDGHCDHCAPDCKGSGNLRGHDAATCGYSRVAWNTGACPLCIAYAAGVSDGASHEHRRIRGELLDALNDGGYDGLLTYMEGL